ncbi:MAG: terminase small subunit [Treponema sp.]|jgi:hypothetical protein|nr:terminase small subunit [Treponema sp.]
MSSSDNNGLAEREEGFELTEWDAALKGRRRLFVLYYCTDKDCFMNAFQAYKKAYTKIRNGAAEEPGYDTAHEVSSRLMQKPEIRGAIRKLLRRAQDEIDEETQYQLLRACKDLALFNPADIIDARGRLRVQDLSELGEKARCIAGITTKYNARGQAMIEIKLADRFKAIESLMKYLELIRPEGAATINAPILVLTGKEAEEEAMKNVTETGQERSSEFIPSEGGAGL